MDVGILFLSIALQFTAAGLAINLIRRTGYRLAWGTIAAALALMGVRRSITFWKVISGQDVRVLDPTAEIVALVISLLMLTGVILIGRMFEAEKEKAGNLEAARMLLRRTIDAAPLVISIKDPDQRYVFTNKFSAERFGLEPEDFEGRTLAEVLGESGDIEFVRSTSVNDGHVVSSGEKISFYEEVVTIGGKINHMLTSKTPLVDENGNVAFLLTVALDITARKNAEEALKITEKRRQQAVDRLENAISVIADGFALYDAYGRLVFFNESFRRIHRHDSADLVPTQTTYDQLGHLDKKRSRDERDPLSFDERLSLLRRDGPSVILQHIGDNIYERRQSATPEGGIISTITDVTELKNAEKESIEAKTEAEQANSAKSKFLASMSHELRTPLNAVIGFSQMLKMDADTTLTQTQKEYLEYVVEGGNHLLQLVDEVLDLAKIEADELHLNFKTIDVGGAIADCLTMVEPLRESRNIEIKNGVIDKPSISVHADELRFKQILLNLISNSIRYNRKGGTVSIDGKFVGSRHFRITVADSGHGIPQEDKDQVFRMFHKIGRHPEVPTEGTGIGLYVSKLLVERMGGKIDFESTVNVGSIFWIELPTGSQRV